MVDESGERYIGCRWRVKMGQSNSDAEYSKFIFSKKALGIL